MLKIEFPSGSLAQTLGNAILIAPDEDIVFAGDKVIIILEIVEVKLVVVIEYWANVAVVNVTLLDASRFVTLGE